MSATARFSLRRRQCVPQHCSAMLVATVPLPRVAWHPALPRSLQGLTAAVIPHPCDDAGDAGDADDVSEWGGAVQPHKAVLSWPVQLA
jgi:hypothetical protein